MSYEFIGRLAVRYPETTVYACSLLGMTVGLFGLAGLFGLLGLACGAGHLGFQVGIALYAVWFASNVSDLKADAEFRIASLKLMR